MRRNLLIAFVALIALPVALLSLLQVYRSTLPGPKLPLAHEIVTIRAVTTGWLGRTGASFAVPQRHWNRILDILSQARRTSGMKWAVYGDLKVTSRDGTILDIAVYDRDS